MKPLQKVATNWSPEFSYAIGLIATDGNLSPDGRHINFTSKDLDLVILFKKALDLANSIGRKGRGGSGCIKTYYVIQFGDVLFYKFLQTIGFTPNKSKTIGPLAIPERYFFDFFRGCIDGDGNIHTFKHPESRNPQLRVRLCSASKTFLDWMLFELKNRGVNGYFNSGGKGVYCLAFAMRDSIKLLNFMYYPGCNFALGRKYFKAKPYLRA